MGTSGVPFDISKDLIIKVLKRHNGKVTYAAVDLKCEYSTLKKHIDKDPELVTLLAELRHQLDEILCDSAESVLADLMANARKDATNALKSAMYALNNKGRQRGYTPPKDNENLTDSTKANDRVMQHLSDRHKSSDASAETARVHPEVNSSD